MSKKDLYTSRDIQRPSGNGGVRPDETGRSPFRKDYARLLHAPSFRRLQGKTQLFPGSESDFFRNRLTHSLEVAQIARGIAGKLNITCMPRYFAGQEIDEDLVEFAAIAHDLGHPPFGHNGEHALDELMLAHGGFEGNAQTLHILSAIERKLVSVPSGADETTAAYGLDLTYRSLAAVLKYDSQIPDVRATGSKLHKGYYKTERRLVDELKEAVSPDFKGDKFKTLECAIMDIADDIAYSTYDLEDSLHGGFITPFTLASELMSNVALQTTVLKKTNEALNGAGFDEVESVGELLEVIAEVFYISLPSVAEQAATEGRALCGDDALKLNVEAWLFDRLYVKDELARTSLTAERVGKLISAVELDPNVTCPELSGVKMSRQALLQLEVLKHLNFELVIRSPRLAVVQHRGHDVVTKIFCALKDSKGALLPPEWQERYREAEDESEVMRVICDYVACMTDSYAAELYQRLFDEGPTIFKPL